MDTLSFNTFNSSIISSIIRQNQRNVDNQSGSSFDPVNVLIKKHQEKITGFEPDSIEQYDPKDLKELEDYCKARGIIGVGFNKMSPKAILNMLKNKTGIPHKAGEPRNTLLHD